MIIDGKEVPESSTGAGMLTGDDVDFLAFESETNARLAGKEPGSPGDPDPRPVVEAPAPSGDTPASEPDAKPKTPTVDPVSGVVDAIKSGFEALKPKEEPKVADPKVEDKAPRLSDEKYQGETAYDDHQADLTAWLLRQMKNEAGTVASEKLDERRAKDAEKAALETRQKNWETREAEAKTRHTDYDALKESAKTRTFNATALEFMADSKIGPDLFVHYVKNEKAWNDLIKLSEKEIDRELTRVEYQLEQTLKGTGGNGSPAPRESKLVSDALPPAKSLSGGRGAPPDNARERAAADDSDEGFLTYERETNAELAGSRRR